MHAPADGPVALVDLKREMNPEVDGDTEKLRHARGPVRDTDFVTNLETARRMLEDYRVKFRGVVTSRLHCYLPARALGVKVKFLPKNPDDVRFDGLIGTDDTTSAVMQERLRDKISAVLPLIVRGADEETVRSRWREVCAPDVQAAQERRQARELTRLVKRSM